MWVLAICVLYTDFVFFLFLSFVLVALKGCWISHLSFSWVHILIPPSSKRIQCYNIQDLEFDTIDSFTVYTTFSSFIFFQTQFILKPSQPTSLKSFLNHPLFSSLLSPLSSWILIFIILFHFMPPSLLSCSFSDISSFSLLLSFLSFHVTNTTECSKEKN